MRTVESKQIRESGSYEKASLTPEVSDTAEKVTVSDAGYTSTTKVGTSMYIYTFYYIRNNNRGAIGSNWQVIGKQ